MIFDSVKEEIKDGKTVLKSIIDIVIAKKKACQMKIA